MSGSTRGAGGSLRFSTLPWPLSGGPARKAISLLPAVTCVLVFRTRTDEAEGRKLQNRAVMIHLRTACKAAPKLRVPKEVSLPSLLTCWSISGSKVSTAAAMQSLQAPTGASRWLRGRASSRPREVGAPLASPEKLGFPITSSGACWRPMSRAYLPDKDKGQLHAKAEVASL
ncbi:MAG: hypothetical protein FRX49_05799 [Trebouxia sp. A1-2]|nr:MAG: hypothetical protein FRX49_05799 [Trebouxia sp. A1-2]